MQGFDEYAAGLPNPFKDQRPPAVMATDADIAISEAEEKAKRELLNPKKHTEARVKYVLKSCFGADVRKDGDWITTGKGFRTFQKKTSDLIGGVMLPGNTVMSSLYVEVKGCSPGMDFALARLDTSIGKKKSQHERLTEKHDKGHVVWLAIGWWCKKRNTEPVLEQRKSRTYRRWVLDDLYLSIDLIPWGVWINSVLPDLNRRMFRRKDHSMVSDCRIEKVGNRWQLSNRHWWWHLHYDDITFLPA